MNIEKTIRFVFSPIRNNIAFYLAVAALFSISIITVEYGRCSRMRAGLEMFSDIYFLCLFVSLFPLRIRRFAKAMAFAVLYVAGLIDMVCYQTMGIAVVPSILQTWIQTNPDEASEAVGMHYDALFSLPIILIAILPLVIFKMGHRLNKLPIFIMLLLCVLTLVSAVYGVNNKRYLFSAFTRMTDDDMADIIEVETMTREYLPIYRWAFSVKEIHRFKNMRKHLLENVKHTVIDSCNYTSPQIVLIIGESYNRHHSSLYGYAKQTNPLQEKMVDQMGGKMYLFDNVITSYNLTFKSFQNMLTFYNYDSKGKWYDYTIVPALFKKAGYEVDFFSNQLAIKKSSTFSDFCEDVFLSDPELSKYMFNSRNNECHTFDMQLIDDYDCYCGKSTNLPRLIIFHFIGIHADFSLRYPKESYNVFSPKDYCRQDLDAKQKQILADYDNAIVYNDKVVASIVEKFADDNAIIIYVPDHGELVYDGCSEMGRNFQNRKEFIIPQFDIPFWMYCTKKYEETHKHICRQIEHSVHRPFMTDDLPHLLAYLAGIKCKEYSPERNLIDNSFNVTRKRIIRGETDYDSIINYENKK